MNIKVLDTNVILEHSLVDVIKRFDKEPTRIIIPFKVLMELDTFKKGDENKNYNTRRTLDFLKELRKSSEYKLSEGIPYKNCIIQVYMTEEDKDIDPNKTDNSIILIARDLNISDPAVIMTEDFHETIIADLFNVGSEEYGLEISTDELYTGIAEFPITDKQIDEFYHTGSFETKRQLFNNQFTVMEDTAGGIHYGIYKNGRVVKLQDHYEAWKIKPKKDNNGEVVMEQAMLMHLLLDPNIQFITATGPSGCGKTLLTLACALEQTIKTNKYDKVIVMRPLVNLDRDLGALPGTKLEKIEPWMASTFDNLEYLFDKYPGDSNFCLSPRDKIYDYMSLGKIELEAMQFIRGRSIPNQFIICDDCFTGDTVVITDKGLKDIKSLANLYDKGEPLPKALSFNEETKEFEYKDILNGISKGKKRVIELCFGQQAIRCTPEHKFLTINGWKMAKDILPNDFVLISDQSKYGLCALDRIIELKDLEEVFDIEVEDNHNFVINTDASKNTTGIVVHNCQNLTPHQATTIITRAGEGSKVVFLGDINKQQIDNHRLNSYNNGLTYVIQRFKGADEIIGHISLETVVRSKLASLGVKLL